VQTLIGVVGLLGCLALSPAMAAPADAPATIVVTAERPKVQTLVDRTVYNVTSDLQATTGSAADVLNNIPSVGVDADGVVSVRGDTNVTVLVDGKPSAQFAGASGGNGLLQFPASDIDRVEVITSPPASMKAEGSGGVINIITKKSRKAGLAGTAQASLGDKRRYVASVSATYNEGPLSLHGGATLRQDDRRRQLNDSRAVLDPTLHQQVLSREVLNEALHKFSPLAKGGLDYRLTPKSTLSLEFSHGERGGDRFFDQHNQSNPAGQPLSSSTTRYSDGHDWREEGGEGLRLTQGLWRPDETLTLDVHRSAVRERERYYYTNVYGLPVQPNSHDHLYLSLDLVTTEASADYEWKVSATQSVKLGYDFERDDNAYDNRADTVDPTTGTLTNNPNVTSHFRYLQKINSVYASYDAELWKWGLQAGLRFESTDARARSITAGQTTEHRYSRVYPSLHLDRALSEDLKLTLGMSRRVTRPDPEALNPFVDAQDVHNLRAGNPNLLPQDTWLAESGLNWSSRGRSLSAKVYGRLDRDNVTDVTQVISNDVVLATKANLPKAKSAGLELGASGKLLDRVSYNLSSNLFWTQIDARQLGAPGLRSTIGVNGKASLDWKPTAVDTAQLSYSRTDRRLTPQGEVAALNLINLGYKRQLAPDLALVSTVSDALNAQKVRRYTAFTGYQDQYQRWQKGQLFYIGVVYTFGAQKKSKPQGFEYEQ
jgi:outer membrane receptor protein involved in Fe transport